MQCNNAADVILTLVLSLEMGIEPNSNPIFGLSEPNERNVIADQSELNCQAIRTKPELCGKGSIPTTLKNSHIWITTHHFIKLMMFLSECVLLKHFNCERPPDCRTKCKIHVYCKVILCDWYTKTEPELQFQSNWTKPNLDKTPI